MKRIFYLMAVATLFCACDPYKFEQASFIELKKDPCFGVCPVYSFKVDGQGNASFKGIRNVNKVGNWNRKLKPETSNMLFEAFETSNFARFKEEYTAEVTDLPTTWITYSNGVESKTIKDYFGAPEALKNLEKMVETIAEQDDDWVKTNENPGN